MANKDYYDILGVSKSASKEEIKKAYKKLAKKYHPDISQASDAEQKFKEINDAASVLLDDQKRQQYDTYGSADGPSGFGGFGGGSQGFDPSDFGINLDDIFEQFGFGGFGDSRGGFSSRRKPQKDNTLYDEIEISLEDVYFGTKKEIKLNRDIKCSSCDGIGAKSSSDVEKCTTCEGSGIIIETQRSILGQIRTQRTCPDCEGKGEKIINPCDKCNGKGTIKQKEEIEVTIPKGIENGMTIRVSQKGNYDTSRKSYADLYLKVFVKESSKFDVEGADLYKNININFIQAIIGDEVEIDFFDKDLSINIPSGTQPGTILRLRNKGLPYLNQNHYGDLYIKINIEIPKKTTKEQKKILHEYVKTLNDKSLLNKIKKLFT
ncbi:MAG: molecular chaperone DnaJ [Nanoarchaeota archaeon]